MPLALRLVSLPQILTELETQLDAGKPQHVQVRLQDGSVVEGPLNTASPEFLSVLVGRSEELRHIAVRDVAALAVARPHRGHEGLLAIGGVIGGTAAMIGWSFLPWVDPAHGSVAAITAIFVVAGATFELLRRKTALGPWLVRWEQVYEAAPVNGVG